MQLYYNFKLIKLIFRIVLSRINLIIVEMMVISFDLNELNKLMTKNCILCIIVQTESIYCEFSSPYSSLSVIFVFL